MILYINLILSNGSKKVKLPWNYVANITLDYLYNSHVSYRCVRTIFYPGWEYDQNHNCTETPNFELPIATDFVDNRQSCYKGRICGFGKCIFFIFCVNLHLMEDLYI